MMEITGWVSGQMFLQTVDQADVQAASNFLNNRGIPFQVLTTTEQVNVEGSSTEGDESFAVDRFSIAVQLAGFPHLMSQVIADLTQRAHTSDWTEPTE